MGTRSPSTRLTAERTALCWRHYRSTGLHLLGIYNSVQFNDEFCSVSVSGSNEERSKINGPSTVNNLAYLVPILTNVLLRRKTMHAGPFYMGQVAGMSVNIISVLWLIFAIVFFSFPFEMPATVSNMNYTCVVVGGFLILELCWWLIAGKKYSRTVQRAREEEHNAAMIVEASSTESNP